MATVEEAIDVLNQLQFPRQQRNERSALTLLALLELTPDKDWSEAADPMRGITQLMDLMAEHYGKQYAPNTRETVRRQTVHQFLAAGLLVLNPDEPDRPTNSAHRPVNPKRREELRDLFSATSAGLVFVTAFENRRTLAKYVADISWETEVWVAEDPTHLIHFDGERFLGPYEQ